jgi:F0F1-type ATP synthase membrane subunit c/vacuolar-type H+-ATPase subunit K
LIPFLVAGAGVGIGLVFSGLITATSRNPALRPQLFAYAILGFALSEATGWVTALYKLEKLQKPL